MLKVSIFVIMVYSKGLGFCPRTGYLSIRQLSCGICLNCNSYLG
jgi:hypothetical protein